MTPTAEQLAIIDAAQNTADNLIIEALAGAAKTTTLELIAKALPGVDILCLAFNKKIAVEMSFRLPSNCEARTLNSIGHSVWATGLGKRITINTSKTYKILTELVKKLPDDEQKAVYADFGEIMKTVSLAKAYGFVPDGVKNMARLHDESSFFATLEEELPPFIQNLICDALRESITQAWKGVCDFDDQVYMPTLGPGVFPRKPLVLIDEAQDLSELNHAMLAKLAKKRLIAVGDRCQAIYAFRGANNNSMDELTQRFSMRKLQLTTSFRCPRRVVQEAHFRAPQMLAPEWAVEGTVEHLTTWTPADIPESSAILCRNNAPLFNMAIKLLKAGRYPELIGNDIGKGLIKIMQKFGKPSMPQTAVIDAIESWREEKLKKSRAKGSVNDRADCLTIFAEMGDTLGDAIAYAEHIFTSSGPIKLMTVHKSKGLEFPNVFILDAALIRQEGQDPNLRYVAITRAKENLRYINSENFTVN